MNRPIRLKRTWLLLCILVVFPALVAQEQPVQPKSNSHASAVAAPHHAPDFTLKSSNGEPIHLSDYHGRVVLLDFWATWCGPCKILIPWLADLQTEFGAQGLQVVGVALDADATTVEIGEFADGLRVNYPILVGNEQVAQLYGGVPAMPESYLISRDGKIVARIIGLKSKSELRKEVLKALSTEAVVPKLTGKGASDAQPQNRQ